MTDLHESLSRTLLLMRDELRAEVTDAMLLDALTNTRVAVVADEKTLASPSAQSAFVTTALLCARSGHSVYLLAPDVALAGIQPPLKGKCIMGALTDADGRIVPAPRFEAKVPSGPIDLEICLGATAPVSESRAFISLAAEPWSASLSTLAPHPAWKRSVIWPLGAMAGAALAASEAFKAAMRKLRPFARDHQMFDELLKPISDIIFALAPLESPMPNDLGSFDIVSGGAITNAALYALSRIPGVRGLARIFEYDIAEGTNLNRYMLLLRDHLSQAKATHLSELDLGGISVQPVELRYEGVHANGRLAERVLVGVDNIPTRWNVQRAQPPWLGIGATTHWSAMASFHMPGLPCAGCLHPSDDPFERLIPTVAFVSFMAGLLQIAYFLSAIGGQTPIDQQVYLTLLRPETVWRSSVAQHSRCPIGHIEERATV